MLGSGSKGEEICRGGGAVVQGDNCPRLVLEFGIFVFPSPFGSDWVFPYSNI